MRLQMFLLVASLLGVVGGAFLIAPWAVGAAIVFDSLAVGVWALFHDDGVPERPQVHAVPGSTLQQVLDRARAS
jgi:hypothetical protein